MIKYHKYCKKTLDLISILSNGKHFSKKNLCELLNINIDKIDLHIQNIKKLGVDIVSCPYSCKLITPINLLNEKIIKDNVHKSRVLITPIINSTNQYLIDNHLYLISGDVCIAEYQFAGRGRYGRSWFSPFGINLYISMYWKFNRLLSLNGLSIVVSMVTARLLQNLGAKNIRVKWPNDIYLGNKKLAGVLVEVQKDIADDTIVFLGIGINLSSNKISSKNKNWTYLQKTGLSIDRNLLASKLINTLFLSMKRFECNEFASFIKQLQNFNIYQ